MRKGYFIIIRGPLGSGKTTISKQLSRALSAEHIAIDRVIDTFAKEREAGMISQKTFKKANEIIAPTAKKLLDQGKPVIFDGNFYWKSQIDDLIQKLEYPHYVLTLKAPLEVCVERDKNRNKTHGADAAEAVYSKVAGFDYGTTVDVTADVDACVKKILSYLPSNL